MNLFKRMIVGLTTLLCLATFSSVLGLYALREISVVNKLTLQDTELALRIRQMRAALFAYNSFGLTAAYTKNPADKRNLEESRAELDSFVGKDLPSNISPEIRERFASVKKKTGELLMFASNLHGNGFVSPEYKTLLGTMAKDMDHIMLASEKLVTADRERNEIFRKLATSTLIVSFALKVVLLLTVLIVFRKKIVLRLSKMNLLVERIRRGELSAQWNDGGHDEIGKIGDTLNRLTRELSSLRKERIEFIGSVAHDINNPLAAVGLNCDIILREREFTREKINPSIERIKGQVFRIKALTDDLLSAVKQGNIIWKLKMREFSIGKIMESVVEAFEISNPEHEIQLRVEPALPDIHGDPDRIYQVITNLLSNAAKYSPLNSVVEVEAGTDGAGIFLEVRDRGIGIPADTKQRIFQPFVRLSEGEKIAEGMGLGLSIVKNIVTAHGGTVTVLDRPGGGSIFRVFIPSFSAATGLPARKVS